jgi:hypothetical protein
MSIRSKVVLTPSAQSRLEELVRKYRANLLDSARDNKFSPGEDVIELTAGDLDYAIESESQRTSLFKRYRTVVLVSYIYIIGGLLMAVYGLFYDQIAELIRTNRQGFAYLVLGAMLIVAGLGVRYYFKLRLISERPPSYPPPERRP